MKFICYSNSVSPHQLPLARELVRKLGVENYRYVATNHITAGRVACGWTEESEPWIVYGKYGEKVTRDTELETCEVLLTGIRELELFEKRAQKGLKTFYQCERWFKPITLFNLRMFGRLICVQLPGWVKMFVPRYRKMAKRFVKWANSDTNGYVLAIGPWAKKDMLSMGVREEKIVPWGYFVVPSDRLTSREISMPLSCLKVLWVGRMLDWKRVDTIIRAVGESMSSEQTSGIRMELTIVGDGPEKNRLQSLTAGILRRAGNSTTNFHLHCSSVSFSFLPSQPIDKIRAIMRAHDVYVLSSDAGEGWGAALSEALEEGLFGLGTFEAGASATILPNSCLFRAGDWRHLSRLLIRCAKLKTKGQLLGPGIGEWSALIAAEKLFRRTEQ